MQRLLKVLQVFFTSLLIPAYADWILPAQNVSEVGIVSAPAISCNIMGNAVSIWITGATKIQGSFFNGSSWGPVAPISTGSALPEFDVSINDQNVGFAIWIASGADQVLVSKFNGSSWDTPFSLTGDVDLALGALNPHICSDGNGNFIAIWEQDDSSALSRVTVSIFNGSIWSTPVFLSLMGTDAADSRISCDGEGNAFVVWVIESPYIIEAIQYKGGAWQPIAPLSDASITSINPNICTMNGKANAVWYNDDDNTVQGSHFNGNAWTPIANVFTLSSSGASSTTAQICCNGDDEANAIWNQGGIHASHFNGASWTPTTNVFQLSAVSTTQFNICCIDPNRAVAVWEENNSIHASIFNGLSWSSPSTIISGAPAAGPDICCYGANALAAWDEATSGQFQIKSALYNGLLPPPRFRARLITNRSATQEASSILLSWSPSPLSNVTSFRIYRNGLLIATVPASQLSYKVCFIPPCVPLTFTIESVDAAGNVSPMSTPLTI